MDSINFVDMFGVSNSVEISERGIARAWKSPSTGQWFTTSYRVRGNAPVRRQAGDIALRFGASEAIVDRWVNR